MVIFLLRKKLVIDCHKPRSRVKHFFLPFLTSIIFSSFLLLIAI